MSNNTVKTQTEHTKKTRHDARTRIPGFGGKRKTTNQLTRGHRSTTSSADVLDPLTDGSRPRRPAVRDRTTKNLKTEALLLMHSKLARVKNRRRLRRRRKNEHSGDGRQLFRKRKKTTEAETNRKKVNRRSLGLSCLLRLQKFSFQLHEQ